MKLTKTFSKQVVGIQKTPKFNFEKEDSISVCLNDFMTIFLRYLEPVYYEPSTIVYQQFTSVDEMVFLTEGQMEVGYNNEQLLVDNGYSPDEKLVTKRTKLSSFRLINDFFKKSNENIGSELFPGPKIHFPLVFKPG